MAQGKGLKGKSTIIKSKSSTAAAAAKKGKTHGSASGAPLRKGRVVKATKKAGLAKHNKLQKKLVAGMTASLEQTMAVKAGAVGKLTIMKDAQEKGKAVPVKRRKY
ncbi:hypothetical protein LPJ53_001420 [Coemansia erecta]|uniref:Uncharacterized protein n=1 Tax=Coemansia erecta TaxID=147472 RepID=A0A9W7Y5S4_9FUNG|nr:hypothetical protein LPJ53_001420 [Coemansia erecta]